MSLTPRLRSNWIGDNYTTYGKIVGKLQAYLNSGPYNAGAVDNKWGSMTKNAVKDFQYDAGLSVDGVVGTRTWGALVKYGV